MTVEKTVDNIGVMLVREGKLSDAQYQAALRTQQEIDQPIGRILVDMGLISEDTRVEFLKEKSGAPVVLLEQEDIPQTILRMIPRDLADKYHVIPVRVDRDGLLLAMEYPLDIPLIDQIGAIVGMEVRPAITTLADIESALKLYDDLESPVVEEEAPSGGLWRLIGKVFLPVMILWPVILMVAGVALSDAFRDAMRDMQEMFGIQEKGVNEYLSFDFFLYFFLTFGLYAIIMYEIDGFLFSRSNKKSSE